LAKKETDNANQSGGWVLALGTLAAAAALYVPLPRPGTAESSMDWLGPGDLGAILALFLATAGFRVFRKRLWPKGPHESRRLRSGVILAVTQAVLLRAAVEFDYRTEVLPWRWWPTGAWLWTPWFITTGLGAMLLGSRLAVLISLTGVLMLYLKADPGPLPLVGCLVASLYGIVLLRRPTRDRVLRAGAAAGLLLGVVAFADGLQTGASLPAVAAMAVSPAVIALLSGFIVLAFLPVMEWALGELSDVSLVEYGSDHPLLDLLKEQAPGTWHHSLNVADLAEKAAAAIGARSLFCRTAALYHDIGKLKEPSIFAENISGPSPHEELPPRVSAQRIIEHVTYGLELARKHRLPKAFREIIAEHHGISVVRFFYQKACAQLGESEDPESLRPFFTYPGPPPSSRESGIIALADTVEAATRTLVTKSDREARSYVRKLIADRVAEGELAQCPLTVAELALAEQTFVTWVIARNHQRPAYPKASALPAASASEWTKPQNAAQPA
jgi:putative nucleotidyltransferase with HDIG domain